jgi:TPP-dependent pyruvate/acetoin dehydrogenase alpha subunit
MTESKRCTEPQMLGELYRSMCRIRRVEERIVKIYHTDKIKSPVHLSIGQEAPSVGVCQALRSTDVVFGTYRGHALYLAKGGDMQRMVAELYGKASGLARGKAGSMHLADASVLMMGTSAIVATTIPHAVGYALAEKFRGRDTVVAVFFGDGASEEGVLHESANFAALHALPVLFVCENNFYAIHTPLKHRVPMPNYCVRMEAYGIPSRKILRNDVLETVRTAGEMIGQMREGRTGPAFLEIETYRWREHVGPGEDWALGYRSREEAEPWIRGDEVERIGHQLDRDMRTAIDHAIEEEVEAAFRFAEESEFPSDEELLTDVFQ